MSRNQPFIDRRVGWLAGKMLTWLGRRAYSRGDIHEFNHIYAAVRAGNSKYPCPVPSDHLLGHHPVKVFDVVLLNFGKDKP